MIITVTHTKARTTTAWFNRTWAAVAISGHAQECSLAMPFCSSLTHPFLFLSLFFTLTACCNISRVAAWFCRFWSAPSTYRDTCRAQDAQGNCGCPTPGSVECQVGRVPEQPGLIEGLPAHGTGVQLDDFYSPFPPKPICDRMWVCSAGAMRWSTRVTALVQCCPHHLLRCLKSNTAPV